MTRQKSDKDVVPQGRVTSAPTETVEPVRGGKVLAVSEAVSQSTLTSTTAEHPVRAGAPAESSEAVAAQQGVEVPKVDAKGDSSGPATMRRVTLRLASAFERVARNKGSAGPDGQSIDDVRKHLDTLLPKLRRALERGTYQPGVARRAWIPKSGGGRRGLNIPNVIDRVVQEAVRQVLEPLFEPGFHPNSHGFRPGRSCHTAIAQARSYVEEGYKVTVDIDLEKFFDRVHHQRLTARVATKVGDREILVLIGRMLKAGVVMPDGVVVTSEEGLPQGGPLSPLLSNIVLDELDWELDRRGHRFVRYADDCNIYVKSERAGHRVMASISRFITRRLRLRVNSEKSAVGQPHERHFLGFTLWRDKDGAVEIGLSLRTRKRLAARVRELTPRNWGGTLQRCITRINQYLKGWWAFFGVCGNPAFRTMRNTDAHIRRRLRAILLKQWKRKRTQARKLTALGAPHRATRKGVYGGRKSPWALSRSYAAERALNVRYFTVAGLFSLWKVFREKQANIDASKQLRLFEMY